MADLGVAVAVIKDGRILLTKREDFEVWCLPGGAVEDGESLATAAVREVYEETGLEVTVMRLVGVYSRPDRNSHSIAFAARLAGGSLRPQEGETIDLGFFDPDNLPTLLPWHHQPIRDSFGDVGGSAVWTYDLAWPFSGLSRSEIYALRDRSGLSRAEFFAKHFDRLGPASERREV